MERATLIRQSDDGAVRLWKHGADILRTTGDVGGFDIYGKPLGARWECTVEHLERYAEVFSWCPPVVDDADAVRCTICLAEVSELAVFPGGICLSCYSQTPEANAPLTGEQVIGLFRRAVAK